MAMASTVQIMAKRIPLIKFPKRPRLGTPAATAAGKYCYSPIITAYIALAMKFVVVEWLPIHFFEFLCRVAGHLGDSIAKTLQTRWQIQLSLKVSQTSWFGREVRPIFGSF